MHGQNPYEDWDGKMYCGTTDAAVTLRANRTQGFMAAYTFTLVLGGWLRILYNGRELTLAPGDLYIYSPGLFVSIVEVSPDYRGICLLADMHTTIEIPAVRDLIRIANAPLLQMRQPVQRLAEADAQKLEDLMHEIIEYIGSNHIYKKEILKMLYAVFLLNVQDIQNKKPAERTISQRAEDVFIGFIRIVTEQFIEHRNIEYYASQLNISPVYLSRIVRQVSGSTVVDYINQMLLMEAVYLLRTTQLSVAQVADRLQFADAASFSKFFSRLKGVPPKAFREGA
ncbi:MAG: AraC family transcriptional regulator [Bacteroidaceae bacterium]|nr:AraC family transcriptional regulator [Bacteroidaceae bacterium]